MKRSGQKNESKGIIKGLIQNREKVVSTIIAIAVILVVGIIGINQNKRNYQMAMNPELAKAITYDQVQEEDKAVNGTENVQFDAFFLRDINNDGYAEGIRGTSKEIGKEDMLYMEINVQTEGHLKEAKISINGNNFYLQTALPKDQEIT